MIIDGELSLSQQKAGRKKLLAFSFLNGVSLTFITGNVLSLYLLQVGCSPSVVAVIASFGYLGTLFAFAGKGSIAKFGAGGTLRFAWIICGLAALALAAIPFLQKFGLNQNLLVISITVVTFLFYIFKSIGTATTQPLMGEFTNEDNRGAFSSKFFMSYSSATVIAIAAVLCLMLGKQSLLMFQFVILTGGILEFATTSLFISMKETTVPKESARSVSTKKLLKKIWQNKDYRNFLFGRSLARSGLILIVPISILALKNYGVSDSTALIYAFIQLGAGIIITYFNSIISEETGPKPLMIIYTLLLSVISILWIFAPVQFNWAYCAVIFFLGGVCLLGLDSTLNHYYLTLIPREDSVGISLWYTVIAGATAGVLGLVLGGGLIKFFTSLVAHPEIFTYYYTVMFFLTFPILFLVLRLKSSSDWKLRSVLKLSVSPHEMHSLYVMHKLNKYSSVKDEFISVHKLANMHSSLSQDHLLYYLGSPRHLIKINALRALAGEPVTDKTKEALLKELKYGEFSTAHLAGYVLVQNKCKEAIPYFRKYLSSQDFTLVGTSMLGLVQLEEIESYPEILQIYINSMNPRILIYGSMAIALINDKGLLKLLLDKLYELMNREEYNAENTQCADCTGRRNCPQIICHKGETIIDEITCNFAKLAGFGDMYYDFLRIYNNHQMSGILYLIDLFDENKIANLKEDPAKTLKDYFNETLSPTKMREFINVTLETRPDSREKTVIINFFNSLDYRKINTKITCCFYIFTFCKY